MKFKKIDIDGDPNIGLRAFATDNYILSGSHLPEYEILQSDLHIIHIAGTELDGIFSAGNSNGIIITKIAEIEEIEQIKKELGLNVLVLKSKETAVGNLILANDNGAIVSPLIKEYKNDIEDVLGVETEVSTIAGLSIVGSSAIATNKGCLIHRDASEEEAKVIEDILKVKVEVGSFSGSPFVKSGLVVNTKGILVGNTVTGPELERIFEVFE